MKKILIDIRGMSMFVVLAMIVILLSIAGASSLFTSISARATGNLRGGTTAFHIADAGINHAVTELNNNDGIGDFTTMQAASNGTQVVSNNSFAGGSYVVTKVGSATCPARIKIRSVGTGPNGSAAQIEAWVRNTATFSNGVCTQVSMSFGGGAIVDSWDSSTGPYGGLNVGSAGNIGSNGNISVAGSGTTISGNASSAGTVSLSGGATVTGTITNGVAPSVYTPMTPCGPPYSSGAGIIGGSYNSATGVLTVGNNSTVTLTPKTYCFSTISFGTHASLANTGAVVINLTSDTDFSAGDLVNSTLDPSKLVFQSSSTDTLQITAKATVYATFNCPTCAVTAKGPDIFYGAIIAKSYDASGGAKLHYDTNLGKGTIKLYSWVQTF
jgi:Tfp pilus assembly protein PilX